MGREAAKVSQSERGQKFTGMAGKYQVCEELQRRQKRQIVRNVIIHERFYHEKEKNINGEFSMIAKQCFSGSIRRSVN